MLAVVDETTPFVGGGVCYGVISAVLLGEPDVARARVRRVIPAGRRRPFHWHQEGSRAKTAMVAALDEIEVLARAVVVPCGRGCQEDARAVAMAATAEQLVRDGCDQLVIEARTRAQDGRDRAVILDVLRGLQTPGKLGYSWERKTNELLWIADAIAGVVHDHLIGSEHDWYERLIAAAGLTLEYRPLVPAQ